MQGINEVNLLQLKKNKKQNTKNTQNNNTQIWERLKLRWGRTLNLNRENGIAILR